LSDGHRQPIETAAVSGLLYIGDESGTVGAMKMLSNDARAALSDLATLALVMVFIWLMAL
jgi:hypothetical protein